MLMYSPSLVIGATGYPYEVITSLVQNSSILYLLIADLLWYYVCCWSTTLWRIFEVDSLPSCAPSWVERSGVEFFMRELLMDSFIWGNLTLVWFSLIFPDILVTMNVAVLDFCDFWDLDVPSGYLYFLKLNSELPYVLWASYIAYSFTVLIGVAFAPLIGSLLFRMDELTPFKFPISEFSMTYGFLILEM